MWNRKLRYAQLLVDALDLDRAPRPLVGVLEFALTPPSKVSESAA